MDPRDQGKKAFEVPSLAPTLEEFPDGHLEFSFRTTAQNQVEELLFEEHLAGSGIVPELSSQQVDLAM